MSRHILQESDIEIRYDCPDDCEISIIDRLIEKLQLAKIQLTEIKEGEDSPDIIESYHRYYFQKGVGNGRLIFTQRLEGDDKL